MANPCGGFNGIREIFLFKPEGNIVFKMTPGKKYSEKNF
jgi:hypothetical protein